MKTKTLTFCIAAGFALAALCTPALAADKDKKAVAKTVAVGTSAVKAAAPKTVEVGTSAVKASTATPVGTAAQAATTTAPTAVAATTTTADAASTPQASEKTSFFGKFKKLFSSDKKTTAEKEQALPPPPASRAAGALPPPPPPAPRAAMGGMSIDDELSAREKAVDSKAFSEAKKVAKLTDEKEKIRGAYRGTIMMLTPMLDRENPGQMDKIQKSIAAAVDKLSEDKEDLMRKNRALFLAQIFSADELSDLAKFYDSSAGQKLAKLSDKIAQDDAMFIQRILMIDSQKAREAVLKEMKKNDLKIPKGME
jgi:hypothetical protein